MLLVTEGVAVSSIISVGYKGLAEDMLLFWGIGIASICVRAWISASMPLSSSCTISA